MQRREERRRRRGKGREKRQRYREGDRRREWQSSLVLLDESGAGQTKGKDEQEAGQWEKEKEI